MFAVYPLIHIYGKQFCANILYCSSLIDFASLDQVKSNQAATVFIVLH